MSSHLVVLVPVLWCVALMCFCVARLWSFTLTNMSLMQLRLLRNPAVRGLATKTYDALVCTHVARSYVLASRDAA